MSTNQPYIISSQNLSHAWGQAFEYVCSLGQSNLSPLIVSIDGFTDNQPIEDEMIKGKLDELLELNDKYTSDVSAMLIFPFQYWNHMGRPDIDRLTELYLKDFLPRLKSRDRLNSKGVYFERMIDFIGSKKDAQNKQKGQYIIKNKNQLKHIVEIWNRDMKKHRRPRRSALQVSCFDPVKDQTGSSMSGFPCLQQVSFAYDNNGGLAVNAYYPTQYMFDRAYGNYLGLCHLGTFMAEQLGLKMVRLNCFVGHPELGGITKGKVSDLREIIQMCLSEPADDA